MPAMLQALGDCYVDVSRLRFHLEAGAGALVVVERWVGWHVYRRCCGFKLLLLLLVYCYCYHIVTNIINSVVIIVAVNNNVNI